MSKAQWKAQWEVKMAKYDSFTPSEREWIVSQHEALPCHREGSLVLTASKNDIMSLVRKGVTEGDLSLDNKSEYKLYVRVRFIIRSNLCTRYSSDPDIWSKLPKRRRLVGKQAPRYL
jgi:hypothetical protein